MRMQPYKMIIGDMVNENKEIWPGHGNKSSNLGGIIATLLPFY